MGHHDNSNAKVLDNAWVFRTSDYLMVGPIGSEHRTVTLQRNADGSHQVNTGYWSGTIDWSGNIDELEARVQSDGEHGWDDSQAEAVCALFRTHLETHDWSVDR